MVRGVGEKVEGACEFHWIAMTAIEKAARLAPDSSYGAPSDYKYKALCTGSNANGGEDSRRPFQLVYKTKPSRCGVTSTPLRTIDWYRQNYNSLPKFASIRTSDIFDPFTKVTFVLRNVPVKLVGGLQ